MPTYSAFLTDSPFELFFDLVGCCLIVMFSVDVADDIATIRNFFR
ncbi:hypothetical protein FHS31_000821 [Sphingomonas vulcanisoli]|uniref:Uncharacterized protein n=1 Tax=Sphingomonas vulcanisoli TaxID=1658060 RepID=A0ABX0TTX2_9SPHN|nr:hypothetical protein [Sphingomonas vulcanisoli]NIJ07225.1 hypothetical protein [Sphingomonas vulcanisoli]